MTRKPKTYESLSVPSTSDCRNDHSHSSIIYDHHFTDVIERYKLFPEVTNTEDGVDFPDFNRLTLNAENDIEYVAGFIVQKLKRNINCNQCSRALQATKLVYKQKKYVGMPFVQLKINHQMLIYIN